MPAARLRDGGIPSVDQLLTYQQAARRLSCSIWTVKRRVRAGELPIHRLGRMVRISEADLARYAAERRIRVGGEAA
jgi:excisionase family DNA binding protein